MLRSCRAPFAAFAVAVALAAVASGSQGSPTVAGLPGLPFRGPIVEPGQGPVDPYHETDDNAFEYWWFMNGDRILDLRRRLAPAPGEAGWAGYSRVSAESRDRVAAALLELLGEKRIEPAVECAALMALAKTKAGAARERIEASARGSHPIVRRHAMIALGVLGDPRANLLLASVAEDRRASGPERQAAILALGLMDDLPWADPPGATVPQMSAPATEAEAPAEVVAVQAVRRLDVGEAVRGLSFGDGDSKVYAGMADGRILSWPLSLQETSTLGQKGAAVLRVEVDPTGERMAVGHEDGWVRVRNSRGKTLSRFRHEAPVRSIAWHPGGDYVATAAGGDAVEVRLASKGTRLRALPGHIGGATAVAFAPDGGAIATGSAGGVVRLFSWEGSLIGEWDAGAEVTCVAFVPRDDRVLAGTAAGALRAFSIGREDGEDWRSSGSAILDLRVSKGGAWAASAAGEHVLVFDAVTGAPAASAEIAAAAVAFSSDGRRLACLDGTSIAILELPEPRSPAPPDPIPAVADGEPPPEAPPPPGGAASRAAGEILASWLDPRRFLDLPNDLQDAVLIAAAMRGDPMLRGPLVSLFKRRSKLNHVTEGYLASAIGRSATQDDANFLWDLFRDGNRYVRAAGAIGLGKAFEGLGGQGEPGAKMIGWMVSKSLERNGDDESDTAVRYLAYAAIGRIGGERAADYFLGMFQPGSQGLRPGKGITDKPFWAFGLGRSADPRAASALARLFDEERAVHLRSAIAMGIGAYGEPGNRAVSKLIRELEDTGSPQLETYLALAIGLAGEPRAIEALRGKLEQVGPDIEQIPRLALALALAGDRDHAQEQLIAKLKRPRVSATEAASLLYSLGSIGDDRSVDAVLEQLDRQKHDVLARSYAAVALGELCDPEPVRKTSRFRVDHLYIANPAMLRIGEFLSML